MGFEPSSLPNLSGKTYIVTGGNTGIGKYTVQHLSEHHAKVYLAARSEAKATAAIEEIKKTVPSADIRFMKLDMMDLAGVSAAAKDFLSKETELHGLVNNAGIMAVAFEESRDGYESQFQTNYLSHWLLTKLLLPTMLRTAASTTPGTVRIVNVTSNGHSLAAPKAGIDFADMNQLSGSAWSRYGMSKLANILHAKEIDRLYGPKSGAATAEAGEIWTAAVHPGAVDTNLNVQITGSSLPSIQPMLKCLGVYSTPDKGAYSNLFAVASGQFTSADSGEYFVPVAKKSKPSKHARDMEMAKKLWDWTEKELAGKELF